MISIGRTTEVILGTIRDYLSKIFNGRTCVASETITISDKTTIARLTLPKDSAGNPLNPTSAEITIEVSTASTILGAAIRYSLSPTAPVGDTTASVAGVPLGDFDTVEIMGLNNLQAFRAIGVDGGTKYLKVQYFR